MNVRLVISVLVAALVAALGIGASYGGDPDKGNVHNATGSEQAKQFAAIVGEDTVAARQVAPSSEKCKRGMAGQYECKGIDMLSRVSRADLGLSFVNDIWGWTDPRSGKHYALIGGAEGTVFVNISKPKRPDIIGTLARALEEGWRLLARHQGLRQPRLHRVRAGRTTRCRSSTSASCVA